MASGSSKSKRQRSTSDVLESEHFNLTSYSDLNRYDFDHGMVHLHNEFNKLFETELDLKKLVIKNTYIGNSFVCSPVNVCHIQVSNTISPDCDDCRQSGWIACNSVLSVLYAKGITRCDSIMMNLVISIKISSGIVDNVIEEIVAGFQDCAEEAGAKVTNGPIATNTYVLIGGVATTFCHISDIVACDEAEVGDILLLTKPLGALLAIRSKSDWVKRHLQCGGDSSSFNELQIHFDEIYRLGVESMRRSNRIASDLMKKYNAHAATDVNGYSLLHSASGLARIQKRSVEFRIESLPLIKYTNVLDEYLCTGLLKGMSQEISGGLLISLPAETAQSFVQEISKLEEWPCFHIGTVIDGFKIANVIKNVPIVEVQKK